MDLTYLSVLPECSYVVVSYEAQWYSLPGHLSRVLQGCLLCNLGMPSYSSRALITAVISVGGVGSQNYRPWWLSITTVDERLCEGWLHGAGVTITYLYCQPRLTFRCVVYGAVWCGLKVVTRIVWTEISWDGLWCRPKSATICARW